MVSGLFVRRAMPNPDKPKVKRQKVAPSKYPWKKFPQYPRMYGETNLERDARIDAAIANGEEPEVQLVAVKKKKPLLTEHRKMARHKFATGCSLKELCILFGYDYQYFCTKISVSPAWKNYMADLDEFDAHETSILKNKLLSMGHKAVEAIEDDLDSDVSGGFRDRLVRQNAAKDVLNRIDVVGEKAGSSDGSGGSDRRSINITNINIKELNIAEKHDLAARLMNQPVDI